MSLIERLHRATAEKVTDQEDPWRRALERALPANLACISTVAILSLLDFPINTANARCVARIMRQLGSDSDRGSWHPEGGAPASAEDGHGRFAKRG
jgi:hypothetical protein